MCAKVPECLEIQTVDKYSHVSYKKIDCFKTNAKGDVVLHNVNRTLGFKGVTSLLPDCGTTAT